VHETALNRPVWRAVTLRRAGRFDPVQFFGGDLIRINSNAANLPHKFQYWVDDGGKPSFFAPWWHRRSSEQHVSTTVDLLRLRSMLQKCLAIARIRLATAITLMALGADGLSSLP
jgi:hypothetical protein